MLLKNFSLKNQLILSFTGFLILCLAAIQVMVWFQDEKQELQNINHRLNKLSLSFNGMQRQEKAFMVDELINPVFYEQNESSVLEAKEKFVQQIHQDLKQLKGSEPIKNDFVTQQIEFILRRMENHQLLFDSLVDLSRKKGFRDYGLIGKMRSYAHALERRVTVGEGMSHLLSLRRREKDYLLRKQNRYINYFLGDYADFKSFIKQTYKGKEQTDLLYLLSRYKTSFENLVSVDAIIGRNMDEGLHKALAQSANDMEKSIQKLNAAIKKESQDLNQRINNYLAIILFILGFLYISVSIYLSRLISEPISRLSQAVRNLADANFSQDADIPIIKSKDEIGELSRDLKDMHQRLLTHNEELQAQNEQIKKANNIISNQKEKMDASSQSIKAAKNIQQLILPTNEELSTIFKDAFVFFKPRDIVSGDFYWYTLHGNDLIFATVDCTGHGVSGAFLSFIANEMLHDIIHNQGEAQASKILDQLHYSIQPYLGQVSTRDNVGMDISLCVWNEKDQLLQFAGAVNPLVLVEDGELRLIKGDRRSIGGLSDEFIDWQKENFSFTQHLIKIKKPTELYLFSDGFKDQLGGDKGKRFRSNRLYELFKNLHNRPAQEKYESLEHTLKEWKGSIYNQLDDIVILGLTLDPEHNSDFNHLSGLAQVKNKMNRMQDYRS